MAGTRCGEDRPEEGRCDRADRAQDPVLCQHEEDRRRQAREISSVS